VEAADRRTAGGVTGADSGPLANTRRQQGSCVIGLWHSNLLHWTHFKSEDNAVEPVMQARVDGIE
jgi:hypothetical protein